jgi:hypothetical protein
MKRICSINQAIKLFKGDLPKVKNHLLNRGIRISDKVLRERLKTL